MQGHNFRTWEELQDQKPTEGPTVMSQAIWCDPGSHAFSSNDSDAQHFTQSRTVKVSGNPYENQNVVTTEVDICGPCLAANNPFQPPEKDPVAELEAEGEAYTKGYDAGVSHALNRLQPPPGEANWNSGSGGAASGQGGNSSAQAHYPDV